jgi:zinc transport system substrate-binding protein
MKRSCRALCAGVCLCLFFPFGAPAFAGEALKVFVTAPPQKYLAERVGGSRVRVSSLVPPGADAHTFEPRPAQMAELAETALYFSLGGLSAFEDAALPGIAALNPGLRIVDLSRGLVRLPEESGPEEEEEEAGAGHAHHAHGHGGGRGDPHIWTSPRLTAEQAKTVCAALTEIDPEGAAEYRANLEAFSAEISEMDAFFRSLFAGREGLRFLVFHPAWAYFAKDYGLVQLAVERDGKEPKAADLARLIGMIRAERIPFLFVSPRASSRSAEILAAEAGISLVAADPLEEDWLGNMRAMGEAVAKALR